MTTPATDRLLRQVDEILNMAQDLQRRGFAAEAVAYPLIAARHLQAVRALQYHRGEPDAD